MVNLSTHMKNTIKLTNEASKYKHYCKCGHSVVIYPFEHKTKKVCSWCNTYVFINKKEEFKYKLKERLNRNGI